MCCKNCFLCVVLLLCLVPLGMGVGRRQDEPKRKRISVKGRLIGYSMRSQFRMLSGRIISLPQDAFLFLLEQADGELGSGEYVKLQYRATPKSREELPSALFEKSTRRAFVVERDQTCDESVKSFVGWGKPVGEEWDAGDAKRIPNLVRLPGAEDIPLPEDRMLPCYSFEWASVEK